MRDTVVLIDDDQDFINFFKTSVAKVYTGYRIISFDSPDDFINSDELQARISCVFFDLYYSGQLYVQKIPEIIEKYFNSELIVLSASENSNDLMAAVRFGAVGYLLKTMDVNRMMQDITIIKKGGSIISPKMARKLLRFLSGKDGQKHAVLKRNQGFQLSMKELNTLRHLALGYSYEEIANLSGISVEGLRSRIRRLYKKLNVKNKMEAVNLYKSENLL